MEIYNDYFLVFLSLLAGDCKDVAFLSSFLL
jgi:hypothetical protein